MMKSARAPALRFNCGTLELHGFHEGDARVPGDCEWDARAACHRTAAISYANVVRAFVRAKIEFDDHAKAYEVVELALRDEREPRPFQTAAVRAWERNQGRGVVVLPTGAGKSHVAVLAMRAKRRSTLVIAPTLDLVRQWYDLLRTSFGIDVGIVGGGEHSVQALTVSTYDSAHLHMEHFGNRFGLVVFDECHHLPSESYALSARFCLAPYRLGLTATPERADGREVELDGLIGPIAYREDIVDLSGEYLSEYETQRIDVHLAPEERAQYEEARSIYRAFVAREGIRIASLEDWGQFVARASRSTEGRRALDAYRQQRRLALAAPAKLARVEELLLQHRDDKVIVFTEDNATAYEISRRFLIPAITHQTKVSERSEILGGLVAGTYGAVVTSKVLNEGVDVPDASVAIVVSGSGSVREHVQRLGRVLRKRENKRAILYELITVGTTETLTSDRRRDHIAYR